MKADNPQWITQLKSRVNQHQVPPPNAEELWAAIAIQQKSAPAPLVPAPWYRRPITLLSVAAALALLVGIGMLMLTPDKAGITSLSDTPLVASIPTESTVKTTDETSLVEPETSQSPARKSLSSLQPSPKRASTTMQASDIIASVEHVREQEPIATDEVESFVEEEGKAASHSTPLPSVPEETQHKIIKHHKATLLPEATISISLYGNGTPRMHRPIAHPQEVILMSSYSLRSTSIEETPKVEHDLDVLLQKGAARFTHKTPINVGMQVALPLSSRISIESGIGYHYLASTISGGQDNALKGTQSLHYIGMPIQLSYQLLRSNQVSFYAQAGCEAAVCVGRIVLFDNPMRAQLALSESYKTPLDKMQWSLLGGFGINYNIARSFDIFVRPQIAYHIDNKSQVPSIYKDKPFDYSITAGLRFVLGH